MVRPKPVANDLNIILVSKKCKKNDTIGFC